MRLEIDLVPRTAWGVSLYRLLPIDRWNGIRNRIIEQSGRKCQICGETAGIMELHERWSYNEDSHVQKLEGFILLCSMCHSIKHIRLTAIRAERGELDYRRVIEHFCRVNDCSLKDFRKHQHQAVQTWIARSEYNWTQDFGEHGEDIRLARTLAGGN